jgi:LPS-assembly protein
MKPKLTRQAQFAMILCAFANHSLVQAQTSTALPPPGTPQPPLLLKPTLQLQELLSPSQRATLPTYLYGERASGRTDLDTVLEGNAVLRRGDLVVRADRLEHNQLDDLAKATGNVSINRAGNVYEGPRLELKVDAFEGFFLKPRYQFLQGGHGEADRVDFLDEKRSVITNATYTTCRRLPGPSWMPDWILKAASMTLDYEEDIGVAKGAVLSFKGLPILPVPYLSFPLSDQRKSGFLPPTIGLDNVNGAELTVPYYWNIAPNRDAKFSPTLMTKRGVNLGAEFRYLESDYAGTFGATWMPNDALRATNRWSVTSVYDGTINSPIAALGRLGVSVNLNRVSDDNHWKDFTRDSNSTSFGTSSLTQRLLANEAKLSWAKGEFSASVRALKWQTLQDVDSPIVPPYDRLPQLVGRYARGFGGFDVSIDADHTQFDADRNLTGQPNARRSFALGQVSRTWDSPGWFIRPKLQLHAAQYEFDAPLANGATSASRAVPTFSLDSGLVFEREANYFGRDLLQTLEPRLFYVATPFRDQNLLPNYDSGATDFNFATIYSENAFVGNDRISDNNLLTLGVSTRLLDPKDGAEVARLGIAQRLRLEDQLVTLPGGAPVLERFSDVLLGAGLSWNPRWSMDSTFQFNPKTEKSTRATIGVRYSPGNYRVVTAAYRFQRDSSEQLDVGWQWPLNDLWGDKGKDLGEGRGLGAGQWYSVGRLNFSLADRKLVDAVIGLEYDAGCWLARFVVEQLQTSLASANQRIMFQLEFVGFARVGANPLKSLKDNISRYQYLREQTSTPSRFSNYD